MSNVSIAGSAAMEAAIGGLHRASSSLNAAAGQVVQGTVDALNGPSDASTGDTVALSDAAQQVRADNSIEGGLLDASSAGLVYTANAAVVNTADATQQSLFDIVA